MSAHALHAVVLPARLVLLQQSQSDKHGQRCHCSVLPSNLTVTPRPCVSVAGIVNALMRVSVF